METQQTPAQARILFVEDNLVVALAYQKFLEKEGFAIVHCSSSEKALKLLETERFNCLVSDLMMPEMDGVEFLKRAREILWQAQTPIVVLSQIDLGLVQEQVKKYGVGCYLCKEKTKPEDLLAAIRKSLENNDSNFKLSMSGRPESPAPKKLQHVIDESLSFEKVVADPKRKPGLLGGLFK